MSPGRAAGPRAGGSRRRPAPSRRRGPCASRTRRRRHPRARRLPIGKFLDHPQHRAPAHRHPEHPGQPGPGPPGHRQADRGERRPQPLGPAAVAPGQSFDLLDERPPPARRAAAHEAPHPQAQPDPATPDRPVDGKPQVGAVCPGRPVPATRATMPRSRSPDLHVHRLDVHVDRQHRDTRDRRKQQPLQAGHPIVHGPALSATAARPPAIFRQPPEADSTARSSLAVCTPRKLSQNPFS